MKNFFVKVCLVAILVGSLSCFYMVPVEAEETGGVGTTIGTETEQTTGAPNSGAALNADMQAQLNALAGEQGAGYGAARDPRSIISRYVKYALGLMGTVATGLAVYAGYLILTAGGEEDKFKEGVRVLKQVAIGALILLSAYSIVLLVDKILAGREDTSWQEGNVEGYDFNWKIEENTDLPKDRYIY